MLTGLPLAGLSKWSGSFGFDYGVQAGPGEVVMTAHYNFRSRYNADTTNSQYTFIEAYGVVNASVGYRFDSHWEVRAYARNLFNENYITALTIQTGNSGLILGQAGDPQMFGLTVRFKS